MSAMDLLDEFSIRVYEPPLTEHRDSGRIADTSNPISIAMLVVDFETEVMMNGIEDFIGNSTGLYGAQTVRALQLIGCAEDAAALSTVLEVAAAAGMTHDAIQADRSGLAPYTVTSFTKVHGRKWDEAKREIDQLHKRIDYSRIRESASRFIQEHENLFRRVLGR